MDNDEEKYLSEFRPRAVGPLPMTHPPARPWVKAVAAAAVLLTTAGIATWYGKKNGVENTVSLQQFGDTDQTADSNRPNLFALTRLALEDDRKFQSELEKESRAELPRFDGPESGLRILARE